jgi:hypothetical protein
MARFILGSLALLGTLIFAFVIEGGKPVDLLLPSPLIIVVCVPVFAVLAVWSLRDWGRAWKDAFAAQPSAAASSARLWDFYEKACYVAAVVGFILGLNIIFAYAPDTTQRLFKSFAVNFITPILAILLAMVARILRARVEKNT